jgi:hypothetical protein
VPQLFSLGDYIPQTKPNKTMNKNQLKSKQPIINCGVIVNGIQALWSFGLQQRGDKYFAILNFNRKTQEADVIELDEALVEPPSEGMEAWNYKGQPFVFESRNKH